MQRRKSVRVHYSSDACDLAGDFMCDLSAGDPLCWRVRSTGESANFDGEAVLDVDAVAPTNGEPTSFGGVLGLGADELDEVAAFARASASLIRCRAR